MRALTCLLALAFCLVSLPVSAHPAHNPDGIPSVTATLTAGDTADRISGGYTNAQALTFSLPLDNKLTAIFGYRHELVRWDHADASRLYSRSQFLCVEQNPGATRADTNTYTVGLRLWIR